MFSFILTISSALAISVIGAYFSIIGLSTIFPGSQTSVVIMGCALEVAKIVTVLWLHRNWKIAKFSLKFYFCFAVFVLMGITSLGIFGYLSKAHIEHKNSANQELTQIENLNLRVSKERQFITQYEDNIKNLKNKSDGSSGRYEREIERAEKRIKEINNKLQKDVEVEQSRIEELRNRISSLDQELIDTKKANSGFFSDKKKAMEKINQKQSTERGEIDILIKEYNQNIKNFRSNYNIEYTKLNSFIEDIRSKSIDKEEDNEDKIYSYNEKIKNSLVLIQELELEKSKLGEKIRAIEAEIGPLKYVVGMLKDFGVKELNSDQAVRLIIIIIMVVFDPLAILLIVAAQTTFIMFIYKPKEGVSNSRVKQNQVKVYEFKEEEEQEEEEEGEEEEDVLEVYENKNLPKANNSVGKIGFRSKKDSTYEN